MKIMLEKFYTCESDYLVCTQEGIKNKPELAKQLCTRRTGAGADGVAFVARVSEGKVYAELFNTDGSNAYLCESAAKACAQSLFLSNVLSGHSAEIITAGGSCRIDKLSSSLLQSTFKVPSFSPAKIAPLKSKAPLINALCEVCGGGVYLTAVYSGMPFAAMLTDNTDSVNLPERGASFQGSRLFQSGINLVFIQIVDNSSMRLRVYRYGCGELHSCGSAAMAAHACAAGLGLCSKKQVTAVFKGGAQTSLLHAKGAGVISDVHKAGTFIWEG